MSGPRPLASVLQRARTFGFLGPGPVESHIHHGRGFEAAAEEALGHAPAAFCDLGAGGGAPGLVLATDWPGADGLLIESARRRAAFLREAVAALDLTPRIRVAEARAELVAHEAAERERYPVVTARSFAEPAVTAEIATGLVAVGGVLVVSEPPEPDPTRWPPAALFSLGFARAASSRHGNAHFVAIRKVRPAPSDLPRGVGRPAKRPRW